jgi:hypothetical protein
MTALNKYLALGEGTGTPVEVFIVIQQLER